MSALALSAPTLPRLLAGLRPDRALTLSEHLAEHGPLDLNVRRALPTLLEESGLRGRGGAGFPTGRKLAAVAEGGKKPIVVVNATEGEPLSGKDKVLLRHQPHLLLDGAALLAASLHTREIVIVTSTAARSERQAVERALAERRSHKASGRFDFSFSVMPDRFVSGEETAIVQHLNGGPALPLFTPPRPFERGVGKRPTLIVNAETVAQVALIGRFGPRWFRDLGTRAEPGSALFTISGAVRTAGVYEAAIGISLPELIALAGGPAGVPRAILVGGYFGSWIPARAAKTITLEDACLRPLGGGLGARAIAVLPETACGLCETARVARYLSEQSAGQCGPCVNGLGAIADGLTRLTQTRGSGETEAIRRWARLVQGRGACRHPDGAARFVASALDVFSPELESHLRLGRCPHGASRLLPVPSGGRA